MGDLVISIDNRLIGSVKSVEQVQSLLRHAKNLVLRRRDAIVLQYVRSRPLSTLTDTTTTIATTAPENIVRSQPSSRKNRSYSVDRMSDIICNDTKISKVDNFKSLNYANLELQCQIV